MLRFFCKARQTWGETGETWGSLGSGVRQSGECHYKDLCPEGQGSDKVVSAIIKISVQKVKGQTKWWVP